MRDAVFEDLLIDLNFVRHFGLEDLGEKDMMMAKYGKRGG